MEDTSDDFFNDFSALPTKTASQLNPKPTTTTTTTRQPPPPRASTTPTTRTTASTASRSAYNSTSSSTTAATRSKPPPPPQRTTDSTNGTSTRAAAGTPLRASSSSRPTGSYYGNKTTAATGASQASAGTSNNPYITSVSAPAAQPSYYSSTPVAPYNYGGAATAAAPAANSATTTTAAAASPTMTSHPAPVPQIMNPYMLGNHQSAPAHAPAPDQFMSTSATASGFSGTMDTSGFSGSMDTNNHTTTTFIPNQGGGVGGLGDMSGPLSGGYMGYDASQFQDEPPLLEELGINVEHIFGKMRSVALPFQRFGGNMDATVIQDADLAGPIALVLLLGGELMFSGKLQFGYIYGFGLFGCISMTLVLNFMSPTDAISFWTVTSILGYSLLPVNLLAALKIIVVNLGNLTTMGRILGIITVFWCTVSSTRLMEQGCDMRNQRYLIAYPIGLLYTAFVMITIF